MELAGRMDEHGRLWVSITVRGNRAEATVEGMIDTGFTEALSLPAVAAITLGLELVDIRPLELADG